jgi:hypothetical protein
MLAAHTLPVERRLHALVYSCNVRTIDARARFVIGLRI